MILFPANPSDAVSRCCAATVSHTHMLLPAPAPWLQVWLSLKLNRMLGLDQVCRPRRVRYMAACYVQPVNCVFCRLCLVDISEASICPFIAAGAADMERRRRRRPSRAHLSTGHGCTAQARLQVWSASLLPCSNMSPALDGCRDPCCCALCTQGEPKILGRDAGPLLERLLVACDVAEQALY